MAGEQPLGPLRGFNVPQQTDLMRGIAEPIAPKGTVRSALKEFTSDLMFTISKSLAASAEAPGGRGTALGIAAAIAGPSQRRMLVQQQEDEKAKADQLALRAEAELEQTRAQTKKLETENWGLRNPQTKYREITRPDGSKGWEPETPYMQTAPAPPIEDIEVEQTLEDGRKVKVLTPKVMGMITGEVAERISEDPAVLKVLDRIYGAEAVKKMSTGERKVAVREVAELLQPFGLDLGERLALRPTQQDPDAKPATAAEKAAVGFYERLENSTRVLDGLESHIAGLGLGGQVRRSLAPNAAQTPEGQRFNQATGEFINAALRRESGAAISDEEYARYGRIYFPQPGDSSQVLSQKKEARRVVIAGLKFEAGNALTEWQAQRGNRPATETDEKWELVP